MQKWSSIDQHSYTIIWDFKGVLHPRPVFLLFMHFAQKLQHIGSK